MLSSAEVIGRTLSRKPGSDEVRKGGLCVSVGSTQVELVMCDDGRYLQITETGTTAPAAMEDSGGCERQRVDESRKNVRSYEREPVDFGTCFEVPVHSLTLVATTLIRIQNPLAGARSYQTYS